MKQEKQPCHGANLLAPAAPTCAYKEKGDRMKVTIDRMQCVSCGSCWDTCPALFVQNADDSFSQIVPGYQEKGDPGTSVELPGDIDCARSAADLCPVTIITVEE